MKCVSCGESEMVKKKVEYNQFGIHFGDYDAIVCPKCNETIFEGQVSEQIEKKAKELGIWGLSRKTKIGTSGSSLDVKIPKQIAEFLHLKKGQEVIIEPAGKNKIEVSVV
ncbi:hypothetical protein HY638_02220 [Candidatus Woesearchaeota archaeon]|nr:hypothetical protein [Candidatus Woesearchaeota archaeon]